MYIYNHRTIKWENDGTRYCLHVYQDAFAEDPRQEDFGCQVTTMACWHRHRILGDNIGKMDPDEFWRDLVRKNVPEADINAAAIAGSLTGVSACVSKDNPSAYDIRVDGTLYEGLPMGNLVYYVLDDMPIKDCQMLLRPYAEWLPIWGYEHSGITISCGPRVGQYADPWDSGQLGVIVALKDTMVREFGVDANDDKAWREKAEEVMRGDVELYDQYLTGEVYGYDLHEFVDDGSEDGAWDQIDGCSGFYGSDPIKNGMADQAGYGLKEAIEKDQYEVGEAKKHVCVTWDF